MRMPLLNVLFRAWRLLHVMSSKVVQSEVSSLPVVEAEVEKRRGEDAGGSPNLAILEESIHQIV
jgi:hypothetical protein